MTRVKTVREYVNRKLMEGDTETALKAVDHLNGVAMAAAYLAKRRGEDAELAAIAGLLHDMYAYTAGTYEDHAHKGAELARTMLDEIGVTDEKETEQICSAIYHHD
ncbi:MAG: HD domain-containing protein, partial [Solobacterium sp.]|nr:HD domain-containing protein [Solobacterium sp.]